MASNNGYDLLEAEDAHDLANQGQISPVLNGKRKISAASILTTSSQSSASSQSAPSISSSTTIYEVPISLRSKEAYEFLGLTSEIAARIWSHWIHAPTDHKSPEGPVSFLDMAISYIEHQETNAGSSSADWEKVMRGWGLTEEITRAIMAPEYADLRMTESARFWTIDTMQLRWRALQKIQDVSRERLRKKHGMRKAGGEYHAKQGGAGLSLRGGGDEEPKKGGKPSGGTGNGYTLLWRGQDLRWIKGMIHADGTYDISKMCGMWPSDFQGLQGSILHLSPERMTAQKYAQWAKTKSGCSGVGLIWMRVPNDLIEKNKPVILKYGDDWKKIVFASRRRERFPKEFKALQRRSLIIGHICRNDHEEIEKLGSWQELSVEKNVMMIDEPIWNIQRNQTIWENRRATQYVFNGEDILDELQDAATLRIIKVKDNSPQFAEDTGEEI